MGDRKRNRRRGDASRDAGLQSDLLLYAAGYDADGAAPSVTQRDEMTVGLEGCFDLLEARLADLRSAVLTDPDTAADPDGAGGKRSRFATAIRALDAFDRLSSMASALAREATLVAYAASDEHLVDEEAVPGAARPHLNHETGELVDNGDRWLDRLALTAAGVGPTLRVGTRDAQNLAWEAVQVARLAPHVHARHLAGDWSDWHVTVFLDALRHLPDDVISDADEELAGSPGYTRRVGVGVLRDRIAAFLRSRHLPDGRAALRQGHADRSVTLGPTDLFGMANLNAYLPAPEAKGIDTLLTDLAKTAPEDDPRSMEQRRADSFLACFTGPAALNPALAETLGYEPASIPDPRYAATAVEPGQQAAAREAWESLRLIGASLGLHFAQATPVDIQVHVPITTLMDLTAAKAGKHATGDGYIQDQPRDVVGVRGTGTIPQGVPPRPPDWQPDPPPCDDRQPEHPSGAELCPHAGDGDSASRAESGPHAVDAEGACPNSCPVDYRVYRATHQRAFTPFIDGCGPITTDQLQVLLDDAGFQRILTEPETGAPLDMGPIRYEPTVRMRRRVTLRDGQCRFPDCRRTATTNRRARRAAARAQASAKGGAVAGAKTRDGRREPGVDLDHVREHRPDGTGGTTGDWNLIALCERHHRIKHQTPWTPILLDDGTVTWRNDLLRLTLHDETHHL